MLSQYYHETGWDKYLSLEQTHGVEQYLGSIAGLSYIGHGGTCVAFTNDREYVTKVCIKNNFLFRNPTYFVEFENMLRSNQIPIMPIESILYKDEHFFVYTQKYCTPINRVNTLMLVRILRIIQKLIRANIKVTDVYHRNFALYQNDVYLYDYHDYGFYHSSDHHYVVNIAQLFSMHRDNTVLNGGNLDIDGLVGLEFGKPMFSENVAQMLKNLYTHEYKDAVNQIDLIVSELLPSIQRTFDNYQHYDIDTCGMLELRTHTLEKYKIFLRLVEHLNAEHLNPEHLNPEHLNPEHSIPATVIRIADFGCSIGGIGMKIAQQFPQTRVTLNNITRSELDVCDDNVANSCLTNVQTSDTNVCEVTDRYDVTMYFALLHHILRSHTMERVIGLVRSQTIHHTIIELPFGDDALLGNVKRNATADYNASFYYLESIEIFSQMISHFFDIIYFQKIEYGSDDLNRYVFVLRLIEPTPYNWQRSD